MAVNGGRHAQPSRVFGLGGRPCRRAGGGPGRRAARSRPRPAAHLAGARAFRRRRSRRLPSRHYRLPAPLAPDPRRRTRFGRTASWPAPRSAPSTATSSRPASIDLLRQLWYTIADQNVIQLKAKYAKVVNDDSGVGTRFVAAMRAVLQLDEQRHGRDRRRTTCASGSRATSTPHAR